MTSLEVSLILKISNLSSISNQYVGVTPERNVDRSLSVFLIHLKINSAQFQILYIWNFYLNMYLALYFKLVTDQVP